MANPRRRRRRRSRNRRKRSFRRRSFRRNPPTIQTLGTNLGWAAAGFMTTKFVGNMVGQFMPGLAQQGGPLMRMGIKLGIAYVSAWGLEMAFGRRVFTPTFVGGSIEVIQDAVRTFISPMVPQLAAAEYPLEFYYDRPLPPPEERMGAYYEAEFETTAP